VRAADTTPPAKLRPLRKTLSPWEQAERGRQMLEKMPEEARTKADYARAMDAYRAIYHANPADVHAPAAIDAVAELLAEQGRILHDAKALHAAVGQYEFLRKQYPASSLRAQALLAEGQIEQNDLRDAPTAREKYKLLLKDHPKSEQAEEASAALASLVRDSRRRVRTAEATPAAVAATHVSDARRGAPSSVAGTAVAAATPARAAVPTADGETSLVRALGLKIGRIVIDAGHGGHDSGTLGVDGIEEKDVVLDVALRVGKLLHDRLGAEIVYTRSDDTFVPLETRTAIANKAQADLFLSIHANSSPDPAARGVETYYLNFTTDPSALEVAARENAASDHSVHQLSDLVKKIALKDKIAESREFAADVEGTLYTGLQRGNAGLKDRGVKQAPFVVLIGANMPSILAEISFVTNPRDAGQLRDPGYRQRVAESLYRGVARYEGGLSGTRAPTERAAGQ
jgi:N-acetylmuramoyl-L-alanine amidase